MALISKESIESMFLHTNIIKTKEMDKIRLDNAATMTIQADKCTIEKASKLKLKIDEEGNSQIFETFQRPTVNDSYVTALSIVPTGGDLKTSYVMGASISGNSGHIRHPYSENNDPPTPGTFVYIDGIKTATLDSADRIAFEKTSHVKLIFPDADEYGDDIATRDLSNGMVRYYVSGKLYEHMRGDNVHSVIDGEGYDVIHHGAAMSTGTGRGYDARLETYVINGQLVTDGYHTVKITGGYNTTFEAELEK